MYYAHCLGILVNRFGVKIRNCTNRLIIFSKSNIIFSKKMLIHTHSNFMRVTNFQYTHTHKKQSIDVFRVFLLLQIELQSTKNFSKYDIAQNACGKTYIYFCPYRGICTLDLLWLRSYSWLTRIPAKTIWMIVVFKGKVNKSHRLRIYTNTILRLLGRANNQRSLRVLLYVHRTFKNNANVYALVYVLVCVS